MMSGEQKRSLLRRMIAGNRRNSWSTIVALALTISVGAGAFVQAGQKESPIRVSLPGFVPAHGEVTAPVAKQPTTKPPKIPLVTTPVESPPPPRRSPIQIKPHPQHVATGFDFDRFNRSLQWSMHSGVLTPASVTKSTKSRPPIRVAAPRELVVPALSATGPPQKTAPSNRAEQFASSSEKDVQPATPALRESESIADAKDVAASELANKNVAPAPLTLSTEFKQEPLEQAIAARAIPDIQQHAVEEPRPMTDFSLAGFDVSLKNSLSNSPKSSAPETTPTPITAFDPIRFQSSIESASIIASPKRDTTDQNLPATKLDFDRFNKSILSSMAKAPVDAAADRPATAFDFDRFEQSVESSLQESPPPNTDYDVDRFRQSIDRSLEQPDVESPTSRVTTDFNAERFDHAVSATLAASRLPAVHRSPSQPTPPQSSVAKYSWVPAQPCDPCHALDDFSPTPVDASSMYHDGNREALPYDAKRNVPTQRPLIEWGREFYGDGITPRGLNVFGAKNMVRPKFYVYGDYRTSVIAGRNADGRTDNWAHRLNLDMDFQITDTERFHTFIGPLDQGNQFTRLQLVDGDFQWREEINFTPLTGFFEGDLGVMMGAAHNQTSPFEIPFTIGLVPLLFQNGIWMEDAVTGAAVAMPARHSRLLNWSNYDATFFAVVDQLNSAAFAGNEHAAQAFGTAWFIEAYGGYIESGYAYVRDRNQSEFSYHNITTSFTRRYFDRISNSMRIIVNAGQDLPKSSRTADGVLLLAENSWITQWPLTVVPYANFFVGWDRPQSVARAAASGGILRNTGINFETDGLNGFATLDTTASDTAGFSLGIDLIGEDLDRQLLLEFSYLSPHGDRNPVVKDDQYAVGSRYQFPISHRTLLRFDTMYGWRRGLEDVYGTRMEYRWKF